MSGISKSHISIFLLGLALFATAQALLQGQPANSVAAIGLAVSILAIWRAHASSDEVARQFALNAFALGFGAMAISSFWHGAMPVATPIWAIGFAAFLLAYGVQWARAQW